MKGWGSLAPAGLEGIMDHFFGADINAHAAENAFRVFHVPGLDHCVDIQAHGAISGALHTVGAFLGLSSKTQSWGIHHVAQLTSQDHEWRHPAASMAEGAPANENRKPENDGQDKIIDDIFLGCVYRDTGLCQVEGIDLDGVTRDG